MRLEQDGSSGFTPQTWDLAGNEANFFIRDASNGSTLPFRVFPGAPSNALIVEASTGDVGMGTTSPLGALHVENTTGDDVDDFIVDADGKLGIGTATVSPDSALLVNGAVRLGTGGYVQGEPTFGTRINNSADTLNLVRFFNSSGTAFGTYSSTDSGADNVIIPGMVGIGTDTPNVALDVQGVVEVNNVVEHSDRKWKQDISTIDDALKKVMNLRGVEFGWRTSEFPDMGFTEGTQVGLIAQEVESVIPELVQTDPEGSKSVSYTKLTAVLIEALKEQQAEIARLRAEVEALAASVKRSR